MSQVVLPRRYGSMSHGERSKMLPPPRFFNRSVCKQQLCEQASQQEHWLRWRADVRDVQR
jgi:hypothetical protein